MRTEHRRHHEPRQPDCQNGRSLPADYREIDLEAGNQKHHRHRKRHDRIKRNRRWSFAREEPLLCTRRNGAEEGRSKEQASNHLADDHRLADPMGEFAEHMRCAQ